MFCAHLLFCFTALSLLGDGKGLPAWIQLTLVAISLIGLYMGLDFLSTPALTDGPLDCARDKPCNREE